ncbi:MAG: hypothetical protein M3O70_03580 [Actinomycetota bacterium]|nr:hypothetical protein [Actinomycetota bacterium]
MAYYSDRTSGPVPRIHEYVTESAWAGIVALVHNRTKTGALAERFPELCDDRGGAIVMTHPGDLKNALQGEIPRLAWPLGLDKRPDDDVVFDLIEFVFRHIAEPQSCTRHDFYDHHHLWNFDRAAGRRAWRADVNRVLARSGVAFEITNSGRVDRLVPHAIVAELQAAEFDTGDHVLDGLLDEARKHFVDRRSASRRNAVEKLWDAFERAKTLRGPGDKQTTARRLLADAATTEEFLALLEAEAKVLSGLGNDFRIRHSEVGVVELDERELDYVFARLYALLWLLLRERKND